MGFTVDANAVADFGLYLGAEAGQTLPTIEQLARDEGMSDHGFTGVLEPLGDVVSGEASVLVGTAFSLMQSKLCDLGDSVIAAAKTYGYTENSNVTMLERIELDGDTDEDITFGSGYGGDGFEKYSLGGGSSFQCAQLNIASIDRPDTKYSDDIDEHGAVLSIVDWIWSEFNVDGGKGFTDSMISPLAGNYNSIKANGEAWKSVGENLGLVAASMSGNAVTLATSFWQGEAATALGQFFVHYWEKGVVWTGEQLGEFVSQGFEKIADVSLAIAGVAIDAINAILKLAAKLAARAIPLVGWAWTAVESFLKMVGVPVEDIFDDIMAIVDLAETVFGLFENMENVVKAMEDYFHTLEELVNTVEQIPEIDSVTDALVLNETIASHQDDLAAQKVEVETNLSQADDALTELDEIAAGAED